MSNVEVKINNGGLLNWKELKKGDLITLRNHDKLIFIDKYDFEKVTLNDDMEESSLIHDDYDKHGHYRPLSGAYRNPGYDIVNIERPIEYKSIFKKDEKLNMTIEEISKELGYDVRIVKEGE